MTGVCPGRSVGITLLELAAPDGRPPHWDAKSAAEVLRAITSGPVPTLVSPTEWDGGVAGLAAALLAKDPTDRATAAAARRHPWLLACCGGSLPAITEPVDGSRRLPAAASELARLATEVQSGYVPPCPGRGAPPVPPGFPRLPKRHAAPSELLKATPHPPTRLAATAAVDAYAAMRSSATDDSVNAALLGDRNQWSGSITTRVRRRRRRVCSCCVVQ